MSQGQRSLRQRRDVSVSVSMNYTSVLGRWDDYTCTIVKPREGKVQGIAVSLCNTKVAVVPFDKLYSSSGRV